MAANDPIQGLPPPIQLFNMATGHYLSRALALAAKLNIADLLRDGPRSAEALAEQTQTHADSLRRVLRLLVSAGVFTEDESGSFALASIGELLCTSAPGSMRSSVLLFAGVGIQDSWKELEFCVRTGEPAFRLHDPNADAFTSMAKDAEGSKVFDEAMATFAPVTVGAVVAEYDFSGFGTVVDVGGGNGAILVALLQSVPGVRGIVFDQAHAVERARERIAAAGLGSRCTAVAGNFFEAVPEGGDAYLLKHVIHDWNDERAGAILKNCRRAMRKDGKVLILEGVYPARIKQSLSSRGAASNDVNMLVCTGGRQRSEAEFRALYAASGLELTKMVHTAARLSVIEATPA